MIINDTEEVKPRVRHPASVEPTFSSPIIQEDGDHNNIQEGTVLSSPTTTASGVAVKASKADDAEVDTWQWDVDMLVDFPQLDKLSREDVKKVCEALRFGLVQGWKERLQSEALKFLRERYGKDWYLIRRKNDELNRDAAGIADALSRFYKCSWWEWSGGSTGLRIFSFLWY
jgi:hypothetical protein